MACCSRNSAGSRARKVRTALSVSGSKNFIAVFWAQRRKQANAQEVASLNIESSNQLLEIHEEWNATLKANASSCQERPQYIWNTQRSTQGISGEFRELLRIRS